MYSDADLMSMLEQMTYREVSEKTGLKPSTIEMRLFRHGLIKKKGDGPKDRKCPICGDLFGGYKNKIYCCRQCKDIACRKSWSELDERITDNNRVDSGINLHRLYERDGGTCYICGKTTSFKDKKKSKRGNIICGNNYPSIDHIIPLSKGGKHSWENVKLACLECNVKKGNKLMEVVSNGIS